MKPLVAADEIAEAAAYAGLDDEATRAAIEAAGRLAEPLAQQCALLFPPGFDPHRWEPIPAPEGLPVEEDRLLCLLLALCAVPPCRAAHAAQGVPDAITRATCLDVALARRRFVRRVDTPLGVERRSLCWWRLHAAGRLYRLGRLEFVPRAHPDSAFVAPGLAPGDPVLEMHIPAEAPLDEGAVRESLEAARAFFADRPFVGFTCISWVLWTHWAEALGPASNIARFQRLGTLVPLPEPSAAAVYFVFGQWEIDQATASRDTRLQRALLERLEQNQPLYNGALFVPREGGRAAGRPVYS